MDALPIKEHMKMIGELTDEQYHQYVSFHENNGTPHTKPIIVDYSMEDEIKRGTAVDIDEYLAKKRKELGLKS